MSSEFRASLLQRGRVVSGGRSLETFGQIAPDAMLDEFLEKQSVKEILGELANPEAVEALAQGSWERPPLTESRIEIVLVFVRGKNSDQLSQNIGRVGEICCEHEAFLYSLSGSLVTATFGAHPTSHPASGARVTLAQDLLRKLAANIKVVHGVGDGYYGLFGTGKNLFFSFDFPRFDAALGLLSRADFGTMQEIKP